MIHKALLSLAVVAMFANQTFAQATNTERGAVTGVAAGAIIGGIIGHQNDETPEGALIGGAVGAIAGGLLGKQKDRMNYEHYQYHQERAHRQAVEYAHGLSSGDVVAMSQSGVSSSVIINQIQKSGVQRRIGVNDIITLHQQGVDNTVINAMQQARLAGVEPQIETRYSPRPIVVERPRVVVERPPVVIERYVPVHPRHHCPYDRYRYGSHVEFRYRR